MIPKHFYTLCDGIVQQPPAFACHMTWLNKQDRPMSTPQASEKPQVAASNLAGGTSTGPSLQRASVLFVASVSSFIGASLLLTGL
jgi:hypothetical protein